MDFIISVGNFANEERLMSFLNQMSCTKMINKAYIIVTNTGKDVYSKNLWKYIRDNQLPVDIHSWGINWPVAPAEQMRMRVDDIEPWFEGRPDTIICNFDDDYHFNPFWLEFAEKVFLENNVNYLTLLKMIPGCVNVSNDHIICHEKLSGYNFAKVRSAMGGSFMARRTFFKNDMIKFFDKYGVRGQYDCDFWNIVNESSGIYMFTDLSLYQHTNLTSQYGHYPHAYGMDYDPLYDPLANAR